MKEKQQESLNEWMQQARAWKASSGAAASFVKSPLSMKATVIEHEHVATTTPDKVQSVLIRYWAEIETWPAGTTTRHV